MERMDGTLKDLYKILKDIDKKERITYNTFIRF